MSGRLDSNQRPPEPHSGALAKLRHAPRFWFSRNQNFSKDSTPRCGFSQGFSGLPYPPFSADVKGAGRTKTKGGH
jgi:hypothetical protein